ncbi:glycoside hydrolase superfamily [Pestalotiopsis sp. NC0098]|nr:glycoside hydrolase superfamily [Pestalotiopsis sp. NC0098]
MAGLSRVELFIGLLLVSFSLLSANAHPTELHLSHKRDSASPRERISINRDWKFSRFTTNPDGLSYNETLKPWILPSANDFVIDGTQYQRPNGTSPGQDVEYTQASFDDGSWESVDLPHDWAIKGPFNAPGISGGMGRLPSNGIGWYRHNLTFTEDDAGKSIFIDIDGAMSYSAVWLNGELVGGWPYGYSSYRLDLTPYLKIGQDNLLAVRLDNPLDFSRWYPGAGLYRNVWLVKVDPVHVAKFGTHITTPSVSEDEATVEIVVDVENKGESAQQIVVKTEIRPSGSDGVVATFDAASVLVSAGSRQSVNSSTTISSPQLWGPPPSQKPNLYVAVTTLTSSNGTVIDQYETTFGVRSVVYDPDHGIIVNGEKVPIYGTDNHHDLGSIGAAFNYRAAERQLEVLQEMGGNALRMSHNPPAPELLDLADLKGFLVMDEAFDVWNEEKVTNDYHLLFADWHEPDLRALIRRDVNHPSVIAWSIGNEIPEQRTDEGAATGQILYDIVHEEDTTRPVTSALNNGQPGDGLADLLDVISLNYQGEGRGNSWVSTFPAFHETYPEKMLWTSESASTVSTRGTYLFPVVGNMSQVVSDAPGDGGNSTTLQVSAYDLYAPSWATSPDKVFKQQDTYPYVAGEFVWTGWDYIGEPTPYDDYDAARSSYFGIIDLAGFKKDRFYEYQSRWRPDLQFAHILPHWTWPDRVGEVTPVHVFSSADEAELFVNGESAGRLVKEPLTYRFRWDNVTYAPGELHVVTYKNGSAWAEASKKTAGSAAALNITADRSAITADGYDLSYISVAVVDGAGEVVPEASNNITFSITGPGEIVSTDNGCPYDLTPFPSLTRSAFSGFALAIVKSLNGQAGQITVSAAADELSGADVIVDAS